MENKRLFPISMKVTIKVTYIVYITLWYIADSMDSEREEEDGTAGTQQERDQVKAIAGTSGHKTKSDVDTNKVSYYTIHNLIYSI